MVKVSFTNDQTAFDYALYMIASSYFEKTKCRSMFTERNMLLQYKEQKLDKQYQFEEICIHFMDKLQRIIPKEVFSQEMSIRLRRQVGKPTIIYFISDKYIVRFYGKYVGRRTKVEYQVWSKAAQAA